jgi:NAD(P)-dependent dehydrogenase (short-subunit alcohol dehydrogenase family)
MITDTFRADLLAGKVALVTGGTGGIGAAIGAAIGDALAACAAVVAEGRTIDYEDVWTKIEMCRRHDAAVGLGADHVEQFVR